MANMRMRFDFKPQHTVLTSSPNFPSTTDSTGSKCLYNCSCYCCLQGCCVATCCCCCCCSASFYSPTTPIQTDVKNFVRKPPFLSITVSTAHRWLVTVASILIGNIVLHKKGQSSICNPGKRVIVSSSSVSTSSTSISPTGQANASADIKLKEQHTHWQKHTSYDIANDQQLKTNNLCKMFCNNRKRQRRRRRRRRRPRRRPRRRHRSNRDTNHLGAASNRQQEYQMENTQQDDIFQLSLKKDNALCFSLDSLKAMRTRNNLVSTDSTLRHCSKTKRNRANLVWLLIGLFWLEVKFINCNAVGSGSGYVSNLVAQRSCTLCQLEDHFYSNKDNPHTDYNIKYNNNHNNNHYYKKTNRINIALSDRVRLESIKRQILTKLGLTHKPNVSHPLPKQFIWETIYRADGGRMVQFDSRVGLGIDSGGPIEREQDQKESLGTLNNEVRPAGHKATRLFNQNIEYIFNNSKNKMNNFNNLNNNDNNIYNYKYVNNINNNENSHGYIIQNRTSFTARRSQYHSKTDQRLFISQEKDHGTDSSIFLNPNRLTRLATLRSTKKHKSNNYKNKKKGDNIRKKNKSNLNAYSKSTYLIDINRSKDSSYKNTIGGNNEHNNRVYYNDYSAIRYLQNNKGGNKEYKPLIYDTFTTADQERNGFEREEFFGNTKEIITFAEEGIQYRPYRIVEFAPQKTRVPNQKLSIRSAQMHIRIEKGANAESEANLQIDRLIDEKRKSRMDLTRHRIKIWVFRMTGAVNITEKEIDQDFLFRASFDVDTDNLGWQKFDLTETIREWYSDSTGENLRLLIDCTGCGSQYSLHLFQLSAQTPYAQLNTAAFPNPNRPFLVLHTESSRPRRVRRRAVDCGGAISGQCCKESFYVSFKALGWDDWIIAPRGYFANYCRGECSGPFRTPDTFQTFHAHFIEEYRKMGLLNGMKPCCAPIKFSSMSLIYYGDDGIIKRDLPKMVIDECGCP